jgi:hypothetical protein
VNPWSLYQHKPLLLEGLLIASASIVALRWPGWRTGAGLTASLGALGLGLTGIADYAVYAFGYQLAGWVAADVQSIQDYLAWLRVPLAAVAVVGVVLARGGPEPPAGPVTSSR